MDFFVYRNSTIENLFGNQNFRFSGYDDISHFDENVDVFVWCYLLPLELPTDMLIEEINSYIDRIKFVYKQLPANKLFLVFTLQNFNILKYKQGDFQLEKAIQNFNDEVVNLSESYTNLKVLSTIDFTSNYPMNKLIDWKYYFISKIIINPRLAKDFRVWFYRQLKMIEFKRKKCLVIDLDNTIWGGVVGEDGIDGIKIGGDYPGNAFMLFQLQLVELTKNGVLIAVCSKNNEQDVLDVWSKNPYMILKQEHIVASRINWKSKAENIMQIAEELNIGLDSLVFVDDNPNERDLIKTFLPEVEVPDFPEYPHQLPVFFADLLKTYFAVYSLTDEDKHKTEQYQSNTKRVAEGNKYIDFSEYLISLEMCLKIQQVNEFNVARIAQITQKTNQFNLTTKRYTEADIKKFANSNNLVFCASVSDKFGDSGVSLVAILNYLDNKTVEIDTFLMSCRVLGKRLEIEFVNWMLNFLKQNSVETVMASYIPTNKNMQVREFWDKMDFDCFEESADLKKYKIELQNRNRLTTSYCKVIYDER